ncbi:MAG TPA: Uma2 family endonuclease [Gemmataceae bacterium]|nr:Uma2 family endonuclease [Gemmataceae bacterium]
MSTVPSPRPAFAASATPPQQNGAPLLCNGDRMKQPEFHRRYEAYPEDVKFELVGGIVYMASPLRRPHGTYHITVSLALATYEAGTPGIEASDNATTILGEESEPQPDLALRILPECGGQSGVNEDEYYIGPPELVAEIAHSSRAIDMNQKREDYERAGVLEYIVLCVEEHQLHWFHFPSRRMIRPDRQGIARSRVFPGLWIDVPALLERDSPRLIAAVQQGLASPGHAAFVKRLEKARRRLS